MVYISNNLKEDIKHKVSIVELADEYFGVIRKGSLYSIVPQNKGGEDFSSILLYPNTNSFYRWAKRKGGDIISFVLETQIEGITSYNQAMAFLARRIDPSLNIEYREQAKREMSAEDRHMELTKNLNADTDNRNVIAYLIRERGINKDIIMQGIERGYIKQVKNECDIYFVDGQRTDKQEFENSKSQNKKMFHRVNKNIAFIGKKNGAISNVCYRGINKGSGFKAEEKACDRNWGWLWEIPSKDGRRELQSDAKLYVFEGYVDMLSFLSFKLENNEDINKDMYVSLGSATKYLSAVNIAEYYSLKTVVIGFDNDEKGELYTKELAKAFKNKNEKIRKDILKLKEKAELTPEEQHRLNELKQMESRGCRTVKRVRSQGKDWNVDLQKKRGIEYRGEKMRNNAYPTDSDKKGIAERAEDAAKSLESERKDTSRYQGMER